MGDGEVAMGNDAVSNLIETVELQNKTLEGIQDVQKQTLTILACLLDAVSEKCPELLQAYQEAARTIQQQLDEGVEPALAFLLRQLAKKRGPTN